MVHSHSYYASSVSGVPALLFTLTLSRRQVYCRQATQYNKFVIRCYIPGALSSIQLCQLSPSRPLLLLSIFTPAHIMGTDRRVLVCLLNPSPAVQCPSSATVHVAGLRDMGRSDWSCDLQIGSAHQFSEYQQPKPARSSTLPDVLQGYSIQHVQKASRTPVG